MKISEELAAKFKELGQERDELLAIIQATGKTVDRLRADKRELLVAVKHLAVAINNEAFTEGKSKHLYVLAELKQAISNAEGQA